MSNKKKEIIYSEPVREIMGSPPNSILRWGTTVIFTVFALFILFTWIIRYPDLIPSPVEITTENPPVTLVSKITGKIKHLYVNDKENVEPNQILAVMETAASMDQIKLLRSYIQTIRKDSLPGLNNFPDFTELGELQNYYSAFRKNCIDMSSFIRNDYYGNKIKSTRNELAGLKIYSAQLRGNERLLSENLLLEVNRFKRDSVLLSGKTIADADYERSKQDLNNQRITLQNVKLEISQKNIEETDKQQMIIEYSINRKEAYDKLYSAMDESLRNLMAQIKIWEITYLLISPSSGIVTFTKYWSENQIVNKDEPVLSIIPSDQGKFIGRVLLGMQRSGKVDTGQAVYIKLSGFPHLEYGMVPGRVKTKSLVPSGDAYIIDIELPEGLTTLYGKKLPFTQKMQGTAEIITDDRSLLSRIVSPFRYLLSINRGK